MSPFKASIGWPWLRRAATLALCVALPAAYGQQAAWKPERTVEIVVGASPGGGTDITARLLQRIFRETGLIENTVVVNRPGGSHTLAWTYLERYRGDGHYFSIVNEPLVTNRMIGLSPLSYRDFTPLTVLFSEYMVFVVKPDSTVASGRDLLQRLKSDPARATIGFASAPANNSHFSIGLAAKAAGADLKQLRTVIFKSGGESLTAVLGGHVEVGVNPIATAIGHIEAGRLRPLAVTSSERLGGVLAGVPTWREQGADFTYGSWRVAFGPRDLSPREVAFWEAAFKRVLATDEWKKELARQHQTSTFHSAADTRRFLEAEEKRLAPVILELGLVKKK
jgi:putative tricarboxylic transport membrane protein